MRGREIDLLEVGLYGVPQAVQLVRAPYNKVRGWVFGYPGVKGKPIIRNQLKPLNGRLALGFLDLLEVQFVREFDDHRSE